MINRSSSAVQRSGSTGGRALPFWQRLAAVAATIVLTSFVAGLLWHWLFSGSIPGYLGGVVGGITALPVWELLKRIEIR
jgi:hypothetical protein